MQKIGEKFENYPGVTGFLKLEDAAKALQNYDKGSEENYRGSEILEIGYEGLKALLELEYPIAIVCKDGINRLYADTLSSSKEMETVRILEESDHSLKTNPNPSKSPEQVLPSSHDLAILKYTENDNPRGIISPDEIICYQKPSIDPLTDEELPEDREIYSVLDEIYDGEGIEWLGLDKAFNPRGKVNPYNLMELRKEFIEKTGVIVDRAPLKDKEKAEEVISTIFNSDDKSQS